MFNWCVKAARLIGLVPCGLVSPWGQSGENLSLLMYIPMLCMSEKKQNCAGANTQYNKHRTFAINKILLSHWRVFSLLSQVVFCSMTDFQQSVYQTVLDSEDVNLLLRSLEKCDCQSGRTRRGCCYAVSSLCLLLHPLVWFLYEIFTSGIKN